MVNDGTEAPRKTTRKKKTLYMDQRLTVPGEKYAEETLGISLSVLLEKLLRRRLISAGVLSVQKRGGA